MRALTWSDRRRSTCAVRAPHSPRTARLQGFCLGAIDPSAPMARTASYFNDEAEVSPRTVAPRAQRRAGEPPDRPWVGKRRARASACRPTSPACAVRRAASGGAPAGTRPSSCSRRHTALSRRCRCCEFTGRIPGCRSAIMNCCIAIAPDWKLPLAGIEPGLSR